MTKLVNLALDFSIDTLLENSFKTIQTWGGYVMLIIGAAMLIVAIYQVAKGLMSHGQSQVSWPKVIMLFIFGGVILAFSAGGGSGAFNGIANYAKGTKNTIDELGNAMILSGLFPGIFG